jgi:hypothetical protein
LGADHGTPIHGKNIFKEIRFGLSSGKGAGLICRGTILTLTLTKKSVALSSPWATLAPRDGQTILLPALIYSALVKGKVVPVLN